MEIGTTFRLFASLFLFLSVALSFGAVSLQSPQSATIRVGTNATFAVFVLGQPESGTVQWFENGLSIPNATEWSYTTPIQNAPRTAFYHATVQIDGQTLQTDSATLYVLPNHPENLLAHWSFDGLLNGNIAPDSTGNFDATVVNGGIATGRIGTGALQVNGSDSFMRVSSPALRSYLEGKPFSLLWWHRADLPANVRDTIISLFPFQIYFASTMVTGTDQIMVLEPYHIYIPNYAGTELYGNWRHYALVFDGSRSFFYEDGILRDDWSMGGRGGVQGGAGSSLHFGSLGEFSNFHGSIDDVRIYDVALSGAQILSLGPPPAIEIKRNPLDYRVGIGQTVTLTTEAIPVATHAPLYYEWEVDGKPIPSLGNQVTITGSSAPGIAKVRAKITAGDLTIYTREATIETITSEPSLLLHYDFENDSADLIRDRAGFFHGAAFNIRRLPGRVGRYAAGFQGSYIRVPAAATPLELAGSPYSVAWWIRFERPLVAVTVTAETPQTWGEIIYDLGPQNGPAGYGAQLYGNRMDGFHKSASAPAVSGVFDIFNIRGWMHFAITYDGATLRLYMNGNELASSPIAQTIVGSGAHDLYLGNSTEAIANGDFGGYPWTRIAFGGLLDDFRIYSYALTPNQIRALVDVPPSLVITAASGRIGLAWPDTSEAVFTLEQSASLGPDAQWSPVTPVPTASDGRFQVIFDPTANSTFFRLKK
jgi:hypothetical protein